VAQATKDGLVYFPLDTSFYRDDKIKLLRFEFGHKCLWVILALWSKIYEDKGYYYKFGDDACSLLAEDLSSKEGVFTAEYIKEVIQGCFRRSIFDEGVYEMFGVLTSKSIQIRYFTAKKDTIKKRIERGTKTEVYEDILLLNDEDFANMKLSQTCFRYIFNEDCQRQSVECRRQSGKNPGQTTQSKVEDNKVKESIVDDLNNETNEFERMFKIFETEFGRNLSERESALLLSWIREYGNDIAIQGLRRAAIYKKLNFKYIDATLVNWKQQGKTLENILEE